MDVIGPCYLHIGSVQLEIENNVELEFGIVGAITLGT